MPKYAVKPITVYKRFRIDENIFKTYTLISPYQRSKYKFDTLYTADFQSEHLQLNHLSTFEEFSKYPVYTIKYPIYKFCVKKFIYTGGDVVYRTHIAKGLHSYTSIRKAKSKRESAEIIVECEIPKNSWYYTNQESECVSDALIPRTVVFC